VLAARLQGRGTAGGLWSMWCHDGDKHVSHQFESNTGGGVLMTSSRSVTVCVKSGCTQKTQVIVAPNNTEAY
jgi:hypothetical protein